MEAPEIVELELSKTAKVNRNIEELSDQYAGTILLKLRKYLRNGPYNDPGEPYDGAFGRGKFTPIGVNRFNRSKTSTLEPMTLLSYVTGNTFLLPDHILEMLNIIQDADKDKKTKLKQVYLCSNNAAENKAFTRANSTHHHYGSLGHFIEMMVEPLYREAYLKIISPEFQPSRKFFAALSDKLLSGPNNDKTAPYNCGFVGGTTIQTGPDTYVKVPKHVDVILDEIHDGIRDDKQKLQKIFFYLIDAVLSYSKNRDDSTQKFYGSVLDDFTQQINAMGNDVRVVNDKELRL